MPKLDFTSLISALEEDASVNSSASTLISNLLSEVEAHKNEPAELQALVDQYRAQTKELADAVATGTPGQPEGKRKR
jgi:hypothetical protein